MVGALNRLREEHALAPLPFDAVRQSVSHAAARVVKTGFSLCGRGTSAALQQRFLDIYRAALPGNAAVRRQWTRCLDTLADLAREKRNRHQQAACLTESLAEELGFAGASPAWSAAIPWRAQNPSTTVAARGRPCRGTRRRMHLRWAMRSADVQAAHGRARCRPLVAN